MGGKDRHDAEGDGDMNPIRRLLAWHRERRVRRRVLSLVDESQAEFDRVWAELRAIFDEAKGTP